MRIVSAPRTLWFNCWRSITDSYDRKAWLKSCRYLRRPLGSLTRISRSTPARACNCASLRRSRKLEMDAISVVSLQSSVFSHRGSTRDRIDQLPLFDSSFQAPYAPMFERGPGVQFAQSSAAEPDRRHHRSQRIAVPETLPPGGGTRLTRPDRQLHRFRQ